MVEASSARIAGKEEETPLSQIQTHLSELFRIQLCRNDDHNLAHSSTLKQASRGAKNQYSSANKAKILKDLNNREDERQFREAEILKELKGVNLQLIEKNVKKMVRKMLLLTLEKKASGNAVLYRHHQASLLNDRYASHMHLAAVMGERTQDEK